LTEPKKLHNYIHPRNGWPDFFFMIYIQFRFLILQTNNNVIKHTHIQSFKLKP